MEYKTTFIAILLIGALIVVLNTTGYLNNASNLSTIILFVAIALAFSLFIDFEKPVTTTVPVYKQEVIG
ncbi:hypothetical protein [Acidianus bottle-shaped virus 3 strain ABV3]|uniref:Uncharacterized protein n=1 Tax=Acidianus bottle-shaped virus 3 strain ABV3 TaxID=1732174 RepID=A0A0N9PB20_9VIRU|nr:hypothetical protein AVU00_gp52 [Acidianus bottle-shaped virus 3 strain ABV3]ALG96854.1 hypothetical protein [Acidianus bottle-shaped virus 3 strain ABV3]